LCLLIDRWRRQLRACRARGAFNPEGPSKWYSPAAVGKDGYVGKRIADQFQILDRIGTGGMGSVYKAEQPDMNRYVAVKILHKKYLSRSDLVSRFRREARAMSQLSHPNTARVFLYGQLDDGACYFVMEYLEGRNLAQIVKSEGPVEPYRAIHIMSQVCGALDEAHQAGIIHRDMKPENIFVTTQGGISDFPKVLDFGLAKVTEKQMRPGSLILTREGMVFGTPEFMSPEQAQGTQLDGRSDIYSLGIIMYEMLTGKLPFDARLPMEFIKLHVDGAPIPLSERAPDRTFPPGLESVLMRALAKRPQDRYPTAGAFGDALRQVAEGNPPADLQHTPTWSDVDPSTRPAQADGRPSQQEVRAEAADPAGSAVAGAVAAHGYGAYGSDPRSDPSQAPMSRMPWIVLGTGILLAIGGLVAMAIAFFGQ
jgi:serine/threonine-protein kinase